MKNRWQERIAKWRAIRHVAGLTFALCFGISTIGGCGYWRDVVSPYSEMGSCALTCMKGRRMAARMWRDQYAHCYANSAYSKDIRQGFIDGFVDTCNGGNGCTPLVPPQHYCGIGRKTNAGSWFQGYPLGVAAAESCGACNMSQSALSPALAACVRQPECTPGCIPCGNVPHVGTENDPLFQAIEAGPVIQAPLTDSAPDSAIDDMDVAREEPAEEREDVFPPLESMNDDSDLELPADGEEDRSLPDRPLPSEAIERAIDKATEDLPEPVSPSAGKPPITSVPSTIQSPPPVVGEPVKRPEPFDPDAPPVVGMPVELPNIQVSYDWEGVDWLFGEVDLADALLEHDLPKLLENE